MSLIKLNKIRWGVLITSLVIPFVIAAISGAVTTANLMTWYSGLEKPTFNPPNEVFAPVWTTLYFCMGISLYLIRTEAKSKMRNKALVLFSIQLFFNFCWSIIFFHFHELAISFYWILVLWLLLLVTIYHTYEVNVWATVLLVPYVLWVGFASVLNLLIWQLNPS